jgi:hypothetical protein
MQFLIFFLLSCLIYPALAQDDNSSPIEFDPGVIWMNPEELQPIPGDDYSDHHILPMTLDPRVMVKASNMLDGENNDIWWQETVAWLENDTNLTNVTA